MTRVTFIETGGNKTTIEAKDGDSVMQNAVANGVAGILAECGGAMMCATCHVYVSEDDFGKLEPIGETEDEMLDSTVCERKETSRLSCQIKVTPELDGLVVHLPETQ